MHPLGPDIALISHTGLPSTWIMCTLLAWTTGPRRSLTTTARPCPLTTRKALLRGAQTTTARPRPLTTRKALLRGAQVGLLLLASVSAPEVRDLCRS